MIDRLISIGCSHMYGSEIRGEGSFTKTSELTFAGVVAKQLGIEHEDLSTPGGSNTHIRETALEHLVKNKTPEKTLYLIGWTTVDITSTLKILTQERRQSIIGLKVLTQLLLMKHLVLTLLCCLITLDCI